MKIVRIIGGLGNQMFQYALFLALKHRFPKEDVLVDCTLMNSYNKHNGLELERVFGVELPQASFQQLLKVTWPCYNYNLSRLIKRFLPKRKSELLDIANDKLIDEIFVPEDKYYNGYWLDYRYTQEYSSLINEKFTFILKQNVKTSNLVHVLLNDNNSVSVHVRRGDYLQSPTYSGLCDIKYYSDAIKHIKSIIQNPSFYIFSDDINWCQDNLSELVGSNAVYVNWNTGKDSPLDMMLMSMCRHNILANSTFSIWAANLNKNTDKIICAPAKWTNNESCCKIQHPNWLLF